MSKNFAKEMALDTLKCIDDADMRDNLLWHLRRYKDVDHWDWGLPDNLQLTQESYDWLREHYDDICDYRI